MLHINIHTQLHIDRRSNRERQIDGQIKWRTGRHADSKTGVYRQTDKLTGVQIDGQSIHIRFNNTKQTTADTAATEVYLIQESDKKEEHMEQYRQIDTLGPYSTGSPDKMTD